MISRKERLEVYAQQLSRYGFDNQLWVLVEEIGEFLQALGKAGRARAENPALRDDNHLAEETADVFICLEQFVENMGLTNLIDYMIDFKIRRQRHRMEEKKDC